MRAWNCDKKSICSKMYYASNANIIHIYRSNNKKSRCHCNYCYNRHKYVNEIEQRHYAFFEVRHFRYDKCKAVFSLFAIVSIRPVALCIGVKTVIWFVVFAQHSSHYNTIEHIPSPNKLINLCFFTYRLFWIIRFKVLNRIEY